MRFRILILIFVINCFISCDNNKKPTYHTIKIQNNNTNIVVSSLEKGRTVYKLHCALCHGKDGEGLGRNFPPVANADYISEITDEKLYSIIKNGMNGEIVVNGIKYNGVMPPINLNDEETKNVIEYIRSLNYE